MPLVHLNFNKRTYERFCLKISPEKIEAREEANAWRSLDDVFDRVFGQNRSFPCGSPSWYHWLRELGLPLPITQGHCLTKHTASPPSHYKYYPGLLL